MLSAWSGIRPLVSDPTKKDTQSLARNHIIEVSKENLITIAGLLNFTILFISGTEMCYKNTGI